MTTPIERLSGLVVGVVESVAPDEVRVLLELDAPHSTALNTGVPAGFPRLNGYVLIPNEAGATVAYITWIGIERSPYPKRSGLKDFGLIDLPFPLRKMSLSPVGTLTSRRDRGSGTTRYELSRGVVAFPSVGDQVLIPTASQVEAIVGAGRRQESQNWLLSDGVKCRHHGRSRQAFRPALGGVGKHRQRQIMHRGGSDPVVYGGGREGHPGRR